MGGTVAADINRYRLIAASAKHEYIKIAISFQYSPSKPL
jgi:hypothetical protein